MTEASFVFFISDNAGYAYSVYPRSIPYFIFHGLERIFHGLEYKTYYAYKPILSMIVEKIGL